MNNSVGVAVKIKGLDDDLVGAVSDCLHILLEDEGHMQILGDGMFVIFREGGSMVVTKEDAELILRLS